jgi:hypothetical protein
MNEGARFHCSGVLTWHVIEQIIGRNRKKSNEPVQGAQPNMEVGNRQLLAAQESRQLILAPAWKLQPRSQSPFNEATK